MKHSLERTAHDLRARLGVIIGQRVADPRLAQVTVSEVKPSRDLGVARVYFRTLDDPEGVLDALNRAKAFIRRCLAAEVKMRRVPELIFEVDRTLENAARLDDILREVGLGGEGTPATTPEADPPTRSKPENSS